MSAATANVPNCDGRDSMYSSRRPLMYQTLDT
ncbi:glutamate-cysteine ligase family protein [Glutamicibacter ectropisis]